MKKILALVTALCLVLGMASFASADEIKNLNTYETQARELETWNIHFSQAAADLNVLTNCFDGLLTNDNHGNLKPNAAASYGTEDGGKTWTFTLNEGMKWINKDGEVQADVTAQDWATGLEWVLNYAKNDSYNSSMPMEMIAGAEEYYNYTKELTETEETYRAFLMGVMAYLVTDMLWGILEANHLITAVYVDTAIHFIAMAAAVMLWTRYVIHYLSVKTTFGTVLYNCGRLFLLFETVVVAVNFFYPFLFWFDENGSYVTDLVRSGDEARHATWLRWDVGVVRVEMV